MGTAIVYPTLLAAISDATHPTWRSSAAGIYRFWWDLGVAIGGILVGLLAELFNLPVAIAVIVGLILLLGIVLGVVMREAHGACR